MTAHELRRICLRILPTTAEFEAFLLDYFPDVHRETSDRMLRSARMNVLLQCHGVSAVWQALQTAFPSEPLISAQRNEAPPADGTLAARGGVQEGADPPAAGELTSRCRQLWVRSGNRRLRLALAATLALCGIGAGFAVRTLPRHLGSSRGNVLIGAAMPDAAPAPAPPASHSVNTASPQAKVSTHGNQAPVIVGNTGRITIYYSPVPAAPKSPAAPAKPAQSSGSESQAPPPPRAPGTGTGRPSACSGCIDVAPRAAGRPAAPSSAPVLQAGRGVDAPPAALRSQSVALYRRPAFWAVLGAGSAAAVAGAILAVVFSSQASAPNPQWEVFRLPEMSKP